MRTIHFARDLRPGQEFRISNTVSVLRCNLVRPTSTGVWVDYTKPDGSSDATHLPDNALVTIWS